MTPLKGDNDDGDKTFFGESRSHILPLSTVLGHSHIVSHGLEGLTDVHIVSQLSHSPIVHFLGHSQM